jgi:hypothetical protein
VAVAFPIKNPPTGGWEGRDVLDGPVVTTPLVVAGPQT